MNHQPKQDDRVTWRRASWHDAALEMNHQGYGDEDIAVKFGVSRSAVNKALHRASKAGPKPLVNRGTEKLVLEAYFMWPELSAIGIARRLKLEAGMVRIILEQSGLPDAKGADE